LLWIQTEFLIDGPSSVTGVKRQVLTLKRIALTDLKVNLDGPSPRLKYLLKKFNEGDIINKWNQSAWAKKIAAKKKRENLNDFERYQVYHARRTRSNVIDPLLRKAKKDDIDNIRSKKFATKTRK